MLITNYGIVSQTKTALSPVLVNAATNTDGTQVVLNFNKAMNDVSGKVSEFKINTVVDMDGGSYQKWNNYPDSPVLTSEYPYQVVLKTKAFSGVYYDYLCLSKTPFFQMGYNLENVGTENITTYSRVTGIGQWQSGGSAQYIGVAEWTYKETNNNIYYDQTLTSVYIAKTTSIVMTPISLSSSVLDLQDNKKVILDIDIDTGYQKWPGYPDTPDKTSTYPYQILAYNKNNDSWFLYLSDTKWFKNSSTSTTFTALALYAGATKFKTYKLYNNVWNLFAEADKSNNAIECQLSGMLCNTDVYIDNTLTNIYQHQNITKASPAIMIGQIVITSYICGTVKSLDNGILNSYSDISVVNNVVVSPTLTSAITNSDGAQVILTFDKTMADVSGKTSEFGVRIINNVDSGLYQKWNGLPDSPILTSDYPYQVVIDNKYLYVSKGKYYTNETYLGQSSISYQYTLNNGVWKYDCSITSTWVIYKSFITQSNNPIYTDTTYTIVYFAKNTPSTITTPLALSSSTLDTNDNKKVILSLNADSGYQKWSGYPDSPLKTSDYPYQVITRRNSDNMILLGMAQQPIYDLNASSYVYSTGYGKVYKWNGSTWEFLYSTWGDTTIELGINVKLQANYNVYTNSTLTTVCFVKTTTSPVITIGQTVKTSYTKGTVKSADGGSLESYSDVSVTNIVGIYQKWTTYPDSPVNTSDYPYQCIIYRYYFGANYGLMCSKKPFYMSVYNTVSYLCTEGGECVSYGWNGTGWVNSGSGYSSLPYDSVLQANNSIYSDSTCTTISFAKTTT